MTNYNIKQTNKQKMRINLLAIFLMLTIASCISTQPKITADKNTAEVTKQKNKNPYKLIIGKWKMESYQVYSINPDPTDTEDIIWEFKVGGEVIINSQKGKKASMNTTQYWMNKSILNVNSQLFMYYFEEPLGIQRMNDAKPFGDELWLDSNLDPSVSDHGPKIYFSRVR